MNVSVNLSSVNKFPANIPLAVRRLDAPRRSDPNNRMTLAKMRQRLAMKAK